MTNLKLCLLRPSASTSIPIRQLPRQPKLIVNGSTVEQAPMQHDRVDPLQGRYLFRRISIARQAQAVREEEANSCRILSSSGIVMEIRDAATGTK